MILLPWSQLFAQLKSRQPKPGDWSFGWGTVGIIAIVSAGIILLTWLAFRWYQRRTREIANSPWHLFKELCNAHGLNAAERQLLSWLARERALAQPAMLFVEPACWDLGAASNRARMSEIERLQRRIFAAR